MKGSMQHIWHNPNVWKPWDPIWMWKDFLWGGSGGFHIFFSFFYTILKHVPMYFSCLGKCSNAVWLWGSRNVFVDYRNLHPTFCQHGGQQITIDFFFFEWTYPFNNILPLRLMFSSLVRNTEVIFKRSCMLRSVCLCVHKLMWHL